MKLALIIPLSIKVIFVITFSFSCNSSFSQSSVAREITPEEFQRLLNKQFRLLLTNTGGVAPGSFAGVDLSDSKKVSFSPTYQFENGNLLGFKVNAGTTEKIADIFKNGKLSTNFSFDVEYNTLNRSSSFFNKVSITFDEYQKRSLLAQQDSIRKKYREDTLQLMSGRKVAAFIKANNEKIANLKKTLKILEDEKTAKMEDINATPEELASYIYLIGIYKDDIKKLEEDTKKLIDSATDRDYWNFDEKKKLIAKTNALLEQLDLPKTLSIEGFSFGWFSFGYQLRHDAFKRFDPALDFSGKIVNDKFISHQLRLKYSYYNWSKENIKTLFVTGGITYNYKSNYQDLQSTEVVVETLQDTNSTSSMSFVEKHTAYVGDYKKGLNEALISMDIYWFLSRKNKFAFHFFPLWRICQKTKPTLNLGFGVMVPFLDATDEKSIVNVEAFYNFIDVTRSTENDFRLFKQSTVGLRFTFPIISFKPQKDKV
ncbi:MAG: hypothetical protein ACO1N0_12155 [Fluviicola sp.]